MHSYAIIGQSEKDRLSEREKLIKKFGIPPFQRIMIGEEDKSIAAIRNAQRLLQYQTQNKKNQALIITCAEQLSIPAQQALLKTIEEPPKNTIVILEAQNHQQILPTILSRTQVIFLPHSLELSQNEEKEITGFWAKLFRGDSLGNRLITASQLCQQMENREALVHWIDKQIIFFRNLLHKRVSQKSWGNNFTPEKITRILRILIFTKKSALSNINTKLLVDHLFINLPSLKP